MMTTARVLYRFVIGGALLALGVVLFLFFHNKKQIHEAPPIPQGVPITLDGTLTVGGRTIDISFADTDQERTQGLSDTALLPAHTGKLFIFEAPSKYGFWMKDMRYPLDMVWIDAQKVVRGITVGVAPETYPTVFYPPVDIQYVLELNAGDAAALGFSVGKKVSFKTNL